MIGNGLMTFIDKKTQLSDFFDDDEVVFYNNIHDLSKKLNYYKHNSILRKEIAKKGKIKYFNYFNNEIVSEHIINKIFGLGDKRLKWMEK